VVVKGVLENAGVYSELAGEPVQDPTFDVTVVHPDSDSVFSFSDIELTGNFYNGLAGGPASGGAAGPVAWSCARFSRACRSAWSKR
jgi:hypothetical protein